MVAPALGVEDRPLLACLLPARNCERDLPAYFRSVSRFADVVIALDDGSTDRTLEILAGEPLVRVLLINPRRNGYGGWDDSANRNRLLEAAQDLRPVWIMSLDSDELIEPDEARALRAFVETDAIPGLGYGFRVHRMVGRRTYDRSNLVVFRLFAFEPGQRFPDERLHFVPVPMSIRSTRWVTTSFRIQHVGASTAARRHERFLKYMEADPSNEYQPDYVGLLAPEGRTMAWRTREPDETALGGRWSGAEDAFDSTAPVLSAIIIAQDDEATIAESVGAAVRQESDHPFEVIVVTSGRDGTAEIVRRGFPDVRVVELRGRALPGAARNAGLAVARGEYISFPGSHVQVSPGSFRARIAAHDAGFAMVTGSVANGTLTPAGWASYLLDHATSLPTRPSGDLAGPPAHCSYEAEALRRIGGFPEGMRAGEDTVVNERLWRLGYRAYRSQEIEITHRSPCTNLPRLLRHHFVRGRAMAKILVHDRRIFEDGTGVGLESWLFGYGRQRIRGVERNVQTWGDDHVRVQLARVRPHLLAGVAAAWCGIWFELFALRPWGTTRVLLHSLLDRGRRRRA